MNTSVEQTLTDFHGVSFFVETQTYINSQKWIWLKVTKIPDEKKRKESKKNPIRSVTTHRVI